jgi:hypothetical protein
VTQQLKGPVFPSFHTQETPRPRKQWIAHTGTRARRRNLALVAKQETNMGAGNGQIPAGIPIIGQAATVSNWCVQVVATCNCEAKGVVLVVLGMLGQCPSCHRAFQITKLAFDAQTGQAMISLGLVVPPREAPAVVEGVPS